MIHLFSRFLASIFALGALEIFIDLETVVDYIIGGICWTLGVFIFEALVTGIVTKVAGPEPAEEEEAEPPVKKPTKRKPK